MMGFRKDLTGRIFGDMTVLRFSFSRKNSSYWECKCDCGVVKSVRGSHLTGGKTKTCGCYLKKGMNTKHKMCRTPEYKSWCKIKERCNNPKSKDYKNYGGRGIIICPEWNDSFQLFYDHVGRKPSSKHSIDRINNNGNYEPNNVRWSTRIEQNNNSRKNVFLEYNGDRKTIAQWARTIKIDPKTLRTRIKDLKWTTEKALTQPLRGSE